MFIISCTPPRPTYLEISGTATELNYKGYASPVLVLRY